MTTPGLLPGLDELAHQYPAWRFTTTQLPDATRSVRARRGSLALSSRTVAGLAAKLHGQQTGQATR
jgi:hypothetical protein